MNNALNARLLSRRSSHGSINRRRSLVTHTRPIRSLHAADELCLSFWSLVGARYGALAQLVYISAGLMGFPIFAKGGGPHYVKNRALDTLLASYLQHMQRASSRDKRTHTQRYFVAAAAALIMVYLPGVVWLHAVFHYVLGRETALAETLVLG